MKKFIVSILIVATLFSATPALAFQGGGVCNQQYTKALENLIGLLIKQIVVLQKQIVELKAQRVQTIPQQIPQKQVQVIVPPKTEKIKWKACYRSDERWNVETQRCETDARLREIQRQRNSTYVPPSNTTSQCKSDESYNKYVRKCLKK